MLRKFTLCVAVIAIAAASAIAQYKPTKPRDLKEGEVAVSAPGSYDEAGKTYVLTRDISDPMTPIFLGNDVVLDLNGHTVTFADGDYEQVPNFGFEDGLKNWDVSKAPGAKVVSSSVHPMVGEKILSLKKGDEIVSSYVNLPVANRSYHATCAVATNKMRVTIMVEDANGKPITCEFKGGSEKRVSVPETNRNPKLGGGVLFAHMHNMPAGKYRLRIRAETDCHIDEADIRPAMDVGVGIVGGIAPWATYNDLLKWYPCAFFDYNQKDTGGKAVEGIPVIGKAKGKVVIRNGTIRNGAVGIRSVGVRSNAANVVVELDNVHIINEGINANAADITKARLVNSRFEVDTPFIIDRHNTSEMNVKVGEASEVAHCEFLGGQGNFAGGCPDIHDNLFVNGQTVTNHYSISPRSGTRVYRNRFEPKIGSGIYIGRGNDVEVFDNVFKISSAPPNCEYRYSSYSTNAIRLSDYNEKDTSPVERRCAGNKVYNNKIFITGKSYPQFEGYRPATYAFFISVGGGTNEIYDNEIVVNKVDDGNALALAFFIGGSRHGGLIRNNKVTSNVPAVWIGNSYGHASDATFINNTFIKAPGTEADTPLIRLGSGGNTATDLGFYSTVVRGWDNVIATHSKTVSYDWGEATDVAVVDGAGKPVASAEVVVLDSDGEQIASGKTDDKGIYQALLAEYRFEDGKRTPRGPYTIKSGSAKAPAQPGKAVRLVVGD
jgi:hypothetical protein